MAKGIMKKRRSCSEMKNRCSSFDDPEDFRRVAVDSAGLEY